MENKKSEYEHAEAFMLMHYKCEKCGEVERIWNSRDGVTPYMVKCHNCKGQKRHTFYWADKRKPNYELKEGERYFFTPSAKDVEEQAKRVYKENEDVMGDTTENEWIQRSLEMYKDRPGLPLIKTYIEKEVNIGL